MRLLFLLSVLSLAISQAFAGVSLGEIEKAIHAKGAKWKAGSSWVTDLNLPQQKHLLGTKAMPKPKNAFYPRSVKDFKKAGYADHLDWSNIKGINFMSPVTNQGKCGSCVAFASMATLEGMVNVANNWSGLNVKFAEQYIWACGDGRCDRGWTLTSAASFLKRTGVTDEACMPYESGANGEDLSCNEACSDADARRFKITDYKNIGSYWSYNLQDVVEALQHGPIMGRMSVYADFMSYSSGVYEHVTGDNLGGHAITIVGYDIKEGYWICKNSWGTDWGENGFFRIKMNDDSNIGPGSVQFIVDPFEGAIKFKKPVYREVIYGNYTVEMQSSFPATRDVKLMLYRDGFSHEFPATRRADGTYAIDFDTRAMADGVYTARAVAYTRQKGMNKSNWSESVRFFVLNNAPKVEIGINNLQNGQTVSERIYVDININTDPMPLQKLLFRFKSLATGEVREVETFNIASHTLFGWRTQFVPNGEWEVWAEGRIGNYKQESQHYKIKVQN